MSNEVVRSPWDELKSYMVKRTEQLAKVLPEAYKSHAERFVRIALMYIMGKPDLVNATPESLFKCILDTAKLGLTLDGRMAHVTGPFKITYDGMGEGGKNLIVYEAVLMVDYKGMVAVVKRSPDIKDVFARAVHEGDHFVQEYNGPVALLNHKPSNDAARSSKPIIGVYSLIVQQDGWWRSEWMDKADIDRIRSRSKAKTGPWDTDYVQMALKSCLRRQLKLELDVEHISHLMEVAEREDTIPEVVPLPTGAISYEKPKTAAFSFGDFTKKVMETVPLRNPVDPQPPSWQDPTPDRKVDPLMKQDVTTPEPNKPEPQPTMAEVPDWAAQTLDELSRLNKYGPTMSMGNALMTQFLDQSTSDEDRRNWFPTLFEEWSKKIQPMIQPIDRPTLLKKLTAWQPQLGAIHGMIMQVLKPSLGQ